MKPGISGLTRSETERVRKGRRQISISQPAFSRIFTPWAAQPKSWCRGAAVPMAGAELAPPWTGTELGMKQGSWCCSVHCHVDLKDTNLQGWVVLQLAPCPGSSTQSMCRSWCHCCPLVPRSLQVEKLEALQAQFSLSTSGGLQVAWDQHQPGCMEV